MGEALFLPFRQGFESQMIANPQYLTPKDYLELEAESSALLKRRRKIYRCKS